MPQSPPNEPATRPTNCPFCQARTVDTFAKVITVTTFWRCLTCGGTWTIASQQATRSHRGSHSGER